MQIGGMTCSSCSTAVEQTLAAEPGIQQISVALLSGRAEVSCPSREPGLDKDKLLQSMQESQFRV